MYIWKEESRPLKSCVLPCVDEVTKSGPCLEKVFTLITEHFLCVGIRNLLININNIAECCLSLNRGVDFEA